MNNYFGINFEFDQVKVHSIINKHIENRQKGYVCVVDANVLSIAQKDPNYKKIINNSLINACDGSSIAWLAGLIHKKKFKTFTGPEIFEFYIEKNQYKQLLVGNTEQVVEEIKYTLKNKKISNAHFSFFPLPFCAVEGFDYKKIADKINEIQPDIIWVSLGAPKQEIFMSKLIPYINKGILFGIGAAFNFYIGEINSPKAHIGTLKFIWISRLLKEPKKQIKRIIPYIKLLPKLWWHEKKKRKNILF